MKLVNDQEVADLIAAELKKIFNMNVCSEIHNRASSRGAIFGHLEVVQEFGIFASVIEKAKVSFRAELTDEGSTWVLVGLQWAHHGGGSSGADVGRFWIKDGKITNIQLANKEKQLEIKARMAQEA